MWQSQLPLSACCVYMSYLNKSHFVCCPCRRSNIKRSVNKISIQLQDNPTLNQQQTNQPQFKGFFIILISDLLLFRLRLAWCRRLPSDKTPFFTKNITQNTRTLGFKLRNNPNTLSETIILIYYYSKYLSYLGLD